MLRTTLVRLDARTCTCCSAQHPPHRQRHALHRPLRPGGGPALRRASSRAGPRRCAPLPVQYADFGALAAPRRRERPADRAAAVVAPAARRHAAPAGPAHGPAPARELPAHLARAWRWTSRPRSPRSWWPSARREGFTSYMTLLAAWQALLHRYSGPDGHRRRHAHRQPHAARAAAAHRLRGPLGGAAHGPGRRPHLPRAARPRARGVSGRADPPGRALRATRRGALPAARHRPRPHDRHRLRAPQRHGPATAAAARPARSAWSTCRARPCSGAPRCRT